MSEVVKYLQSYKDYFWQYENAGTVIAIPEGKTIGYSGLILSEIVPLLAPQGLPRFGALLLAMVATNPHGSETVDHILSILKVAEDNDRFKEGIEFAKLLTQVPIEYKKGRLRTELLRGIFYNSHNSNSKAKSLEIQTELEKQSDISQYPGILTKESLPIMTSYLDFKSLGLIGRELQSVEAILERLANLPDTGNAFDEIDFQEQNTTKEGLIENLIKDQNTFHVGSLVSRLMSGLNIPFHSSLPSEQPLGGVADITNKGSFDKLLISEFAFDDVILMSRLANNESLYKHREVPPSDNNYNRVIIIDVTLKNWGTIRTISFASMLAITNHPKNNNPCRVFLVGKSYQEIGFESTGDIVQAMLTMDSSLDPGVGLMKLFTEEQIEVSEIFYIGNHESLGQPVMQLFSSEYGKRIDHWIHPTNEGVITVFKNPKRGKRFIQELKLPLKEAWKRRKEPQEHKETDTYPILFPNGMKVRSTWIGRDFSYVSTKVKALFRYYGSKGTNLHSGLEMIDSNFPNNYNIMAVMTHDDLSITVLVAEPNKTFSLFWPATGKRVPIDDSFKPATYWKYFAEKDYFVGGAPLFSYLIQLDGSVTKRESGFKAKLRNPPISYHKQIYRNLREVRITSSGKLCFGKHELDCVRETLLFRLPNTAKASREINSDNSIPGEFQFEDGSTVYHNRNGMLTLVSSNKDIPRIYIPCVLGSALGVATEKYFTGDRYYRREWRNELLLDLKTDEKLKAIKLIKEQLGIGLKEAKQSVDKGIVVSDNFYNLQYLEDELLLLSIKSTLKRRGLKQLDMKPDEFYQKYIQAFIDQIRSHGN